MNFPCETCSALTNYADAKCVNCWEVEHRLPSYLKSPKGQIFARNHLPKLDDWVDGKPDAWDYETVLQENGVEVAWNNTIGDGIRATCKQLHGWSFTWKYGCIYIGQVSKINARKAAAMYVSLWLRGVSASFANKLMDGYIIFLERQEDTTLTFLADIDNNFFRLTRRGFARYDPLTNIEHKIIEALNIQSDEEVIVTFQKRKKH